MKRIISLLTGTLCTFTFFVSAEELTAVDVAKTPTAETPASPKTLISETGVAASSADVVTTSPENTIVPTITSVGTVGEISVPTTVATVQPIAPTNTTVETELSEIKQPEVVTQQPAMAEIKGDTAEQKQDSWWDKILKIFKVSDEQKRTCDQALAKMIREKTVSIDFSNTSDFAEKGDAAMTSYYKTLVDTKAFGTHSPNLYLNLSKTNVSKEFITKWASEFKNAKKIVLWNLSDNKTIDDTVLDSIDMSSTYSLNLSNTLVTDVTITKIISTLETTGIGSLVCVNLSGANVTDSGVTSLKTAMQAAVTAWKTKNPGNEYILEGSDESGVIFEKLPAFPEAKKVTVPTPDLTLKSDATTQTTDSVAKAQVPVIETTVATQPIVQANSEISPEVVSKKPVEHSSVVNTVEGQANAALNNVDAVISSVVPATSQITHDAAATTANETSVSSQAVEAKVPATDVVIG